MVSKTFYQLGSCHADVGRRKGCAVPFFTRVPIYYMRPLQWVMIVVRAVSKEDLDGLFFICYI